MIFEIIVFTITALAFTIGIIGCLYHGALLLMMLGEDLFNLYMKFMDYISGVNNKS